MQICAHTHSSTCTCICAGTHLCGWVPFPLQVYLPMKAHMDSKSWYLYLSSVTLRPIFSDKVCPWTWSSLLARRSDQKIPGIQLPPLPCHWVIHMGHHAQLQCGHWESKLRSSCLHRNTLPTEQSMIHGMDVKRVIILTITMIIEILIQVITVPLPHTRQLSYLFHIYYATQNTFNLTTVRSVLRKPEGHNTCL